MVALRRQILVIGVILVAIIGSVVYLELRPQQEVLVPKFENIIILCTNDSHGYLLPEGDTGGFAYIASIVDNERTQNPGRILLLDAGDIVDGTPVGDMFYGRSVITVMNAMGYDAMTLGNHEVAKYGIKEGHGAISIENDFLMDLKENAEFPLLAANVLINGSDPFPSYIIKEVGGVRIGIIGVTTNQYPPQENVEILDPATTAYRCVKEIENNVDVIIALTHLGLDADKPFATLVKGVDIIIGGHSHTVMREPENMGGTMIVQAGCHGEYVGRIQLEYDVTNHEIANFSYELIDVKHPPLEENEKIAELVGHYDNMISPIFNVEIGYTEHGLSLSETGEAIAESYILKTGVDIGYQNTGGVRANIPAGSITMGQTYEVMPFPYDRLVSMDLRGDYLKEEFPYGYMAGAYQENGEWYLMDRELIEDNEYYRVATNDYIITSYGFAYGENIAYHGFCWDAFVDYLENTFPA